MTQPKLVVAKRLAELRQDGSDPEVLAKSMSIQKIHPEVAQVVYGCVEVHRLARVGVKSIQFSQEQLPFVGVQTRVRVGFQNESLETTHARPWEEGQQH